MFLGAFYSLFSKFIYQTESKNVKGNRVFFEKPWFQDWMMFLSLAITCVFYFVHLFKNRYKEKKKSRNQSLKQGLMTNVEEVLIEKEKNQKWIWLKISVPAVCDLFSNIFFNIGLLWLSVSIQQMLRCAEIIYVALFTVFYRKRKLFRYEIIGVTLVTLAIVLLGTVAIVDEYANVDFSISGHSSSSSSSAFLSSLSPSSSFSSLSRSPSSPSTQNRPLYLVILSVVFVLIGAGTQAFQAIVEEKVLHDNGCHPLYVLSFEGMWGLIFITCIVFPIVYFIPGTDGDGIHEDTWDTLVMLGNSWQVGLFCVLYVLSSSLYAIVFMYITDIANALTNTVIQQMRNLTVWGFSLFVYYVISTYYGESWDYLSFGELGAFAVLSLGVLIFNGLVKVPCIMGNTAPPAPVEDKLLLHVEEQGAAV